MFEKYTEAARRTIFYARYEASESGSKSIEPEHLLLGMLHEKKEPLPRLLPAEITVRTLRERIKTSVPEREKIATSVELPLAAETKRVLAYAHEESDRLSHWNISNEHLLLGLVREERSLAAKILREHGVTLTRLRETVGANSGDRAAGPSLRVEHIGVATRSIEESLKFWRDALGLEVMHTEVVEEQGVRVAMLPLGEPRIELLEPTGADSPVAKFMEKRGPGIHHVAVRVADICAALSRLKEKGARLIDEEPRRGAGGCLVAFVHPSSAGGVLLELVEQPSENQPRRSAAEG
jgi:methylmalonyl-CoA/ethylmalonyl-CoA epimerase